MGKTSVHFDEIQTTTWPELPMDTSVEDCWDVMCGSGPYQVKPTVMGTQNELSVI